MRKKFSNNTNTGSEMEFQGVSKTFTLLKHKSSRRSVLITMLFMNINNVNYSFLILLNKVLINKNTSEPLTLQSPVLLNIVFSLSCSDI